MRFALRRFYLVVLFAVGWLLVASSSLFRNFWRRSTPIDSSDPLSGRRQCWLQSVADDVDRANCSHAVTGADNRTTSVAWTSLSADDYIALTSDCAFFRHSFGYFVSPVLTSDEERSFPLAFSLLTYENVEQTERLLRLVYRPHNFYCIHVDLKAEVSFHRTVDAIARCLGNVFVARPPVNVTWGEISVVNAELLCMRTLLTAGKDWKYFINLVARDFPLRTNEELVKILKAYNGSNDIEGTRKVQFYPVWFQYRWKNYQQTEARKETPPHSFKITKGSAHITATREFVEYAVNDQKARDLLHWMKDIKIPDEHFFQTLNHNPQFNVPGSFSGDPDSKSTNNRAKHWVFNNGESCSGQWIREVCNVGVGDLPWVVASRQLFVNKIRLESQPVAYRCLELWYRDRVMTSVGRSDAFDTTFYTDRLHDRSDSAATAATTATTEATT